MHRQYTRPLVRCASIAVKATGSRNFVGTTHHCVRQAVAVFHQPSFGCYQGRRKFLNSAVMATSAQFSAGVDETALTRSLEPLLASAGRGGRWALIPGGEGLERNFKFKTFAKTWDFMTAVSLQCKLKNHHPEWSNVYNTTYIRWTTHNPKGLSAKDVELAAICDGLARDFGEIIEEPAGADACGLKQVADRAVSSAGDCCTPKK
ncbi:transcriptional coactivator/pterin dehydratase [Hypoxylon trugodes]|uniref:transcriptional coactivator/pterin dehydratase n=1 Tax=Hypoxylon trugodes TaxID=326681 RepID=UPI002194C0C6|nr:transcriptional coactivator/pterin dehydratase [Hypoxylon trugodes]KAI1394102.1 transcriptional coactivator/pterin dehydratase [Hypoxylon trugodes]